MERPYQMKMGQDWDEDDLYCEGPVPFELRPEGNAWIAEWIDGDGDSSLLAVGYCQWEAQSLGERACVKRGLKINQGTIHIHLLVRA